jgi:hypothetical protein
MPIYRNLIKGGVGTNKSYLLGRRNTSGQFSANSSDTPNVVAAHVWPSLKKYTEIAKESPVKDMLKEVQTWIRGMKYKTLDIVRNAMLPAFNKSMLYCPVSPNGSKGSPIHLRDSGRLKVVERPAGDDVVIATISYGHAGIPFYAVYVHEIPYRHLAPTRHKFLEVALREELQGMKDSLTKDAKKLSGV